MLTMKGILYPCSAELRGISIADW